LNNPLPRQHRRRRSSSIWCCRLRRPERHPGWLSFTGRVPSTRPRSILSTTSSSS
jgi:hypothetical protein